MSVRNVAIALLLLLAPLCVAGAIYCDNQSAFIRRLRDDFGAIDLVKGLNSQMAKLSRASYRTPVEMKKDCWDVKSRNFSFAVICNIKLGSLECIVNKVSLNKSARQRIVTDCQNDQMTPFYNKMFNLERKHFKSSNESIQFMFLFDYLLWTFHNHNNKDFECLNRPLLDVLIFTFSDVADILTKSGIVYNLENMRKESFIIMDTIVNIMRIANYWSSSTVLAIIIRFALEALSFATALFFFVINISFMVKQPKIYELIFISFMLMCDTIVFGCEIFFQIAMWLKSTTVCHQYIFFVDDKIGLRTNFVMILFIQCVMVIEKAFQLQEIDRKILSDKPDSQRLTRSWLICGTLTLLAGGTCIGRYLSFGQKDSKYDSVFQNLKWRIYNSIRFPIPIGECVIESAPLVRAFGIFNWLIRGVIIFCVLSSIVGSIYSIKLLRRLNEVPSNQQNSKLASKQRKSTILLKQTLINLFIIIVFVLIFSAAAVVKMKSTVFVKSFEQLSEIFFIQIMFSLSALIVIIQCGVYFGTCEKLRVHVKSLFSCKD